MRTVKRVKNITKSKANIQAVHYKPVFGKAEPKEQ